MRVRVMYLPNTTSDSIPYLVQSKRGFLSKWTPYGWYSSKETAIERARAILDNPIWEGKR